MDLMSSTANSLRSEPTNTTSSSGVLSNLPDPIFTNRLLTNTKIDDSDLDASVQNDDDSELKLKMLVKDVVLYEDGSVVYSGKHLKSFIKIQHKLVNVESIASTRWAFAAKKKDRTVVVWGPARSGGDAGSKQRELVDVESIASTHCAFAAKKRDGTVVVWGDPDGGGNAGSKQCELVDVESIASTICAFAAKKSDGTVVVWGYARCGGDADSKQRELVDVESIASTSSAFAAKKRDGTVVVWGSVVSGGDAGSKQRAYVTCRSWIFGVYKKQLSTFLHRSRCR